MLLFYHILNYACEGVPESEIPVVLVHGLGHFYMGSVRKQLLRNTKRTVFDIKIQNGALNSLFSNGSRYFEDMATEILTKTRGFHCIDLVGHSQGGFFGRAFVQLKSGRGGFPRVRRFLSVSGVQGGYYCQRKGYRLTQYCFYLRLFTRTANMYSNFIQKHVTFASYWRDPFQLGLHKKTCNLIARIDGECGDLADVGK